MDQPPRDEAKRGFLWKLTDAAIQEGVKSTTRYRSKFPNKRNSKNAYATSQQPACGARAGPASRRLARLRRSERLQENRSGQVTATGAALEQDGSPLPYISYPSVALAMPAAGLTPATTFSLDTTAAAEMQAQPQPQSQQLHAHMLPQTQSQLQTNADEFGGLGSVEYSQRPTSGSILDYQYVGGAVATANPGFSSNNNSESGEEPLTPTSYDQGPAEPWYDMGLLW